MSSRGNRDAFRHSEIEVCIQDAVKISFSDVMENIELADVIEYFGTDEVLEHIEDTTSIFKNFCFEMWDGMSPEDIKHFFATIKTEYTRILKNNDGHVPSRILDLAKNVLAEFTTEEPVPTCITVLEDIETLTRPEQIVILTSLMSDLLAPPQTSATTSEMSV